MTKSALVAIADGSEEIEAIVCIDTLRRAGVTVTVASVGEGLQIEAAQHTKIVADALIDDVREQKTEFDVIVLPGGMPGAENLSNSESLVSLLKEQNAAGKWIAAICASPAVILEKHGLLKGRIATCYPSFVDRIEGRINERSAEATVVVSRNCVTSRGPGTALPFALALIELVFDVEKANAIAKAMLVQHESPARIEA